MDSGEEFNGCKYSDDEFDDEDTDDYTDDDDDDDNDDEPILTEMQKQELHRRKYVGRLYNGEFHPEYFIPRPKRLSNEKLFVEYKEEAKQLKREISNSDEISKADEELETIIYRFEVKLNRSHTVPTGDPNNQPFPLPHDLTPSDVRTWICTWEPFDFFVVPWSCVETKPPALGDTHQHFAAILRPWVNRWKPIDVTVKDRTGPNTDLIKNDIPTQGQLKTLEARSKRRFLHNETKMRQRREKLTQYFQKKYKKSDNDMHKYSSFDSNLKENKLKLELLC